MVNIRIKKIKGRKYLYSRRRDPMGKTVERYIGPVERTEHPKGIHCQRCGKSISDDVIRLEIVNRLNRAREKMWLEKRHISDYAQYEILGVLAEAFAETER